MVVDADQREVDRSEDVDRLFHALADRTRRDILVQAARGDLSVSALARFYPVSLTAIQKHVIVLEEAGLVRKERNGREQLVASDAESLARAREVLDRLEVMWGERLGRFRAALADPEQEQE